VADDQKSLTARIAQVLAEDARTVFEEPGQLGLPAGLSSGAAEFNTWSSSGGGRGAGCTGGSNGADGASGSSGFGSAPE
jgi:hypothetical protein